MVRICSFLKSWWLLAAFSTSLCDLMYEGLVVSAQQMSEGAGAGKHKLPTGIVPFHGALPSGALERVPWAPRGTWLPSWPSGWNSGRPALPGCWSLRLGERSCGPGLQVCDSLWAEGHGRGEPVVCALHQHVVFVKSEIQIALREAKPLA